MALSGALSPLVASWTRCYRTTPQTSNSRQNRELGRRPAFYIRQIPKPRTQEPLPAPPTRTQPVAGAAPGGYCDVLAPRLGQSANWSTGACCKAQPSVLATSAPLVKLAFGGFSDEVLTSQRVVPVRLQESGFEFAFPHLSGARAEIVARWP